MKKKLFCKKIFIFFGILFYAISCKADSLLVGFDSALATSNCFELSATTIDNYSWKAFRSQAHTSGTISYFKWGTSNNPLGCTHDSGCWAIYDESVSGSVAVGSLKAYNCFTGYDWTRIGMGNHTLPVTTTVTDLNITAGNYYWIVMWSNAIDTNYYQNAGCTAHPYTQRLRNVTGCNTANMDGMIAAQVSSFPPPPEGSEINVPVATTIGWGVWQSSNNNPPAAPTGVNVY